MATIETAAKALAFSDLTHEGRGTCDWERDFSDSERHAFRAQATIVVLALRECERLREAARVQPTHAPHAQEPEATP